METPQNPAFIYFIFKTITEITPAIRATPPAEGNLPRVF